MIPSSAGADHHDRPLVERPDQASTHYRRSDRSTHRVPPPPGAPAEVDEVSPMGHPHMIGEAARPIDPEDPRVDAVILGAPSAHPAAAAADPGIDERAYHRSGRPVRGPDATTSPTIS